MAIIAAIARIGLDIAKRVFQVHGVDVHDQPRLRKQLKRAAVLEFFAQLPPCEVGIEACGGAHYWSRALMKRDLRRKEKALAEAAALLVLSNKLEVIFQPDG
jgi:transposase